MRLPLIAGNWKMNTTVKEAVSLVRAMLPELNKSTGVEILLCPPFVSLQPVKDILGNASVKLGAQNMYFEAKGAFTGEVSPPMLVGLCEYVILGHSERRLFFGETDQMISRKVNAALASGLSPILCVGERLEENESGKTQDVVGRQIRLALESISASAKLVVAYEPVWAIGTGKAATPSQANTTILFIRQQLAEVWGVGIAQSVRILYGGSVNQSNIAEFVGMSEIDGALVGGASLKASDFISIVKQTIDVKGKK